MAIRSVLCGNHPVALAAAEERRAEREEKPEVPRTRKVGRRAKVKRARAPR